MAVRIAAGLNVSKKREASQPLRAVQAKPIRQKAGTQERAG